MQANATIDPESVSRKIIISGTGGQGAILTSQILGWGAINAGYKVRTAETHGMAQRGGSVVCYMGMGNVHGPVVPRGMADIILAFEEAEALRNISYANKNTIFLISKNRQIPPGLYFVKNARYPSEQEIFDDLKRITPHVYFIDAKKIAMEVGEPRAENVVMIAFLFATGVFPVSEDILLRTILSFVPKKAVDANKMAFEKALQSAKAFFAEHKPGA
jgi:indolepyruvate ferredoxin oxidoreductase beta subunit